MPIGLQRFWRGQPQCSPIVGIFEVRSTTLSILHEDHSLAYGAWLAIPVIVLLVVGASAQAAMSIRASLLTPE